ncbi:MULTISPECIES: hypothetical protein [Klebsiella]|uniref:hypothetical protein n=1 Tax=Klebsiella pneumoniae complex TaxID=3390273 RepID=UPI001E4A9FF1|nr:MULTISPECIES: hypothetical protein [Klebsiella]MCS6701363.1 hypothetical protein [Klebsiella pneumoniae subsp. pneumoniae]
MTDITELARRVEHIISDMKLKHGDKDTYAPVMKWDEFLALVEALEKAQKRISQLESRTVKLTDINQYLADVHDKTLNRAFRLLAEIVRAGDVAAMRAAGIKVEAE